MTIADFLYQASFWQWLGLIFVAAALSGLITINKNYISKDKE